MTAIELLRIASFVEIAICCSVLMVLVVRRAYSIFPHLSFYLAVQLASQAVSIAILFYRKAFHLEIHRAYSIYFYTCWTATALSFVLQILVIYSVFAEAMRPMSGLHAAGKIVFRWVGVVSLLVALALVTGPGVFTSKEAFGAVVSHLQQGISVLTVCLLIFVCFSARPLGLTFRSHIFGVSLGLGITAVVSLVQAAWLTTTNGHSLYSPMYLISSVGYSAAYLVWGTYFALPEPRRRMILLPTTSPFFFWNRISEILGDAPGHVAVAGFRPDMLAPAEIEMLTAATSREAALAREAENEELEYTAVSARPRLRSSPEPFLAL